jgi:hypothetical protein
MITTRADGHRGYKQVFTQDRSHDEMLYEYDGLMW